MQSSADDMDDLFRRAAEEYPLNTRRPNWEKLKAALIEQNSGTKKINHKRQFLWLLLLLPIALICNRVEEHRSDATGIKNGERLPATLDNRSQQNGKTPASKTDLPLTTSTFGSGVRRNDVQKTVFDVSARNRATIGLKNSIAGISRHDVSFHKKEQEIFTRETNSGNVIDPTGIGRNSMVAIPKIFDWRKIKEVPKTTLLRDDVKSSVPIIKEDHQQPIESAPTKKRRFYVGVIAGPDVSTVKFQQFSEVGFQAGLLFGFQLSDRFAIEAGALSSKKYYYSKGDYLNTSKLYLPANSKVLSVDGNCRMVELPLSLLYTFRRKGQHSWFGAAGLSSYLMKDENYTYETLYTNTGYVVPHQKTYVNQTRNWFSVLQLSVGYTSGLGAIGHLRLAPYYSVPVGSIGYGELPLSSFGLRIGLTSQKF